MDQAMSDLQAQVEEMRRLWQEEVNARTRAMAETARLQAQVQGRARQQVRSHDPLIPQNLVA